MSDEKQKSDTDWRIELAATLSDIKAQLGRLASDRESEKGTMLRLSERLDAEDRLNAEKLARHVEWNNIEHKQQQESHHKLSGKVSFISGVGITLHVLLTLAVGVIALFK